MGTRQHGFHSQKCVINGRALRRYQRSECAIADHAPEDIVEHLTHADRGQNPAHSKGQWQPVCSGVDIMPTPASPDTNRFRCEACGRHFNSSDELATHATDCVAAKASQPHREPQSEENYAQDREWKSTP